MSRSARLALSVDSISPNIAPESGIFPERFLPRLFERTKADVIHRLAGRSGKLGEKIPGKTG